MTDRPWEKIPGWFTRTSRHIYETVVNEAPDPAHFVELGTWYGRSSYYLNLIVKDSNKNIKIDHVDWFKGSVEHENNTIPNPEDFIKNLSPFKGNYTLHITDTITASSYYEDESLDFVFVDASHEYEDVLQDIKAWYPKIKKGGIIAGDDYKWEGVKKAVDEYFKNDVEIIDIDYLNWLVKK